MQAPVTIHAAARGENVVAVYINNAIYGMTGGQLSLIHISEPTRP